MASAEKEYPSCQHARHPWLLASWILFTGGGSRQAETTVPCSLEIFVADAAPSNSNSLTHMATKLVWTNGYGPLVSTSRATLLTEQMNAKEQILFRN